MDVSLGELLAKLVHDKYINASEFKNGQCMLRLEVFEYKLVRLLECSTVGLIKPPYFVIEQLHT